MLLLYGFYGVCRQVAMAYTSATAGATAVALSFRRITRVCTCPSVRLCYWYVCVRDMQMQAGVIYCAGECNVLMRHLAV